MLLLAISRVRPDAGVKKLTICYWAFFFLVCFFFSLSLFGCFLEGVGVLRGRNWHLKEISQFANNVVFVFRLLSTVCKSIVC